MHLKICRILVNNSIKIFLLKKVKKHLKAGITINSEKITFVFE